MVKEGKWGKGVPREKYEKKMVRYREKWGSMLERRRKNVEGMSLRTWTIVLGAEEEKK